jgi:hypothetical protein
VQWGKPSDSGPAAVADENTYLVLLVLRDQNARTLFLHRAPSLPKVDQEIDVEHELTGERRRARVTAVHEDEKVPIRAAEIEP